MSTAIVGQWTRRTIDWHPKNRPSERSQKPVNNKRKEATKRLADETIKIAFERWKASNHEGDEGEYRLKTALQKIVWEDEN